MQPVGTDLLGRLGMRVPVVAAPMAGGTSTPALVAAVGQAGGLGMLAAGYRNATHLQDQINEVRAKSSQPFGVNLFVPGDPAVDHRALDQYAARLEATARRLGTGVGEPRWDDDDYPEKLDILVEQPVPLVSFTFGCPTVSDVARLHRAGSLVAVTVTAAGEAQLAVQAGADLLCVQGAEAGAHQASFREEPAEPAGLRALPLQALLAQVSAAVPVPLVAAGGMMTGRDIAAALDAGAAAAQLGTAFLCCPEAGTSATHRQALLGHAYTSTGFTRAFTGRTARGLVNGFFRDHDPVAPAGYPWVHHMTRPLRTAAAQQSDPDALHLWAGEGWRRIRPLPAADLVACLAAELKG